MNNKRRKVIFICGAIVLFIGLAALALGLMGKLNAPDRITSVAKEYAVSPDIFTVKKVISVKDDWSLIGDGQVDGIYKLTGDEIEQLLNDSPPLRCKTGYSCTIKADSTSNDEYCFSEKYDNSDKVVRLCINSRVNEPHWTYSLY